MSLKAHTPERLARSKTRERLERLWRHTVSKTFDKLSCSDALFDCGLVHQGYAVGVGLRCLNDHLERQAGGIHGCRILREGIERVHAERPIITHHAHTQGSSRSRRA